MRKTITYSTFLIFSLVLVLTFLTARTYSQLAIAIALYPIIIFFALKIFPRKSTDAHSFTVELPYVQNSQEPTIELKKYRSDVPDREKDVPDREKRDFLKLIGTAGLGFFVFSIFNRRLSNVPYLNKIVGPATTAIEDSAGNKINPAQTQPTDGYKISELDDNVVTFYGFIKKGGEWFIMREDTETGSFRYVKGDSKFSNSWNNRERLNYDYYSNVF